jgi:antitoxin component of MazEF toxin-antitoxin module
MTTNALAEIRLRPGNQITLPAHIVKLANLRVGDRFIVSYAEGCILLTPVRPKDVADN